MKTFFKLLMQSLLKTRLTSDSDDAPLVVPQMSIDESQPSHPSGDSDNLNSQDSHHHQQLEQERFPGYSCSHKGWPQRKSTESANNSDVEVASDSEIGRDRLPSRREGDAQQPWYHYVEQPADCATLPACDDAAALEALISGYDSKNSKKRILDTDTAKNHHSISMPNDKGNPTLDLEIKRFDRGVIAIWAVLSVIYFAFSVGYIALTLIYMETSPPSHIIHEAFVGCFVVTIVGGIMFRQSVNLRRKGCLVEANFYASLGVFFLLLAIVGSGTIFGLRYDVVSGNVEADSEIIKYFG
jgi:hypothetical protein